ncbi:hypothetical protein AV530_014372 [Patagioenas fasciata monilis]|uniref:Uncharacterized protein n=1 Tax=Patagioenas fasciata monilis TaxID=372326 RepID=A0A1V4KBG7_PATFA|nr:hypothetical protein AV530_014372 [Patagioenas fasciata monilis]
MEVHHLENQLSSTREGEEDVSHIAEVLGLRCFLLCRSIKLSVRQVAALKTLPHVLHRKFLFLRILLLFSRIHYSSASSGVLKLEEEGRHKNFSVDIV